MERIKKIDKKWIIPVSAVVLLCIANLSVLTAEEEPDPQWSLSFIDTGCDCKKVAAFTLTSGDYNQCPEAQIEAWELFKDTYDGLEDSDRTGNRTYTYNCHSYTFGPGNVRIDSYTNYLGDESGCWAEDQCGTVRAEGYHSCMVSNNEGKCGPQFLCKNNQYVYPDVPIFTVYWQLP